MERFRILKRTYGSGAIVFIPQCSYSSIKGYKNVCNEMRQSINSFATEEEARKKIDEYKKFEIDSKIVSDEIIQINDDDFVTRLKRKVNVPNEINKIHSFVNGLNLSKEQEDGLIDILGNVIIGSYVQILNENK